MKRIKNILAALATLRRVPSAAIASSWGVIRGAIHEADNVTDADLDLIDSLITAIVAIAKDDEDKASAPGKSDKP
jgi:hypothetical protein